jgi:glucokinase
MFAGIDIGGTKCAVAIGDVSSEGVKVVEKEAFPTACLSPQETLDALNLLVEKLSKGEKVQGIGISCGGPLDPVKGIVKKPPNLPEWDNIAVCDYFSSRWGVPAHLQNDANACALAEWRHGAGKGLDHLIFLTFGTGLGAGLILNGQLYQGASFMAGEVGHWRLSPDGPFAYGKAGSFEGFCSGAGIADAVSQAVLEGGCRALAGLEADGMVAKRAAELAEAGDPDCLKIFAQSGKALGHGLSLLIDLLNPQAIILGGIFTRRRDLLWPHAKKAIERETLPVCSGACEIRNSLLGEEVGDYGALMIAAGE